MNPDQVVIWAIVARVVDFVLVQIGKLFEERREQRKKQRRQKSHG